MTISSRGSNIVENVLPLCKGDISDIYVGTMRDKKVILKMVEPGFADLLKNEADTLKKMGESVDITHFGKHLPKFLDTVKVNGKLTNIFEFASNTFTLEQVIRAYPKGLDGKTVAWMWRRMLEMASWLQTMKIVHGAMIPSNVLIHPEDHGMILLDWCYSVPSGHNAKAFVEEYKEFFSPEVTTKNPLTSGSDVYSVAKCVKALFTGNLFDHQSTWPEKAPKLVTGVAEACMIASPRNRLRDPWEAYETLQKNLEKTYGPSKFVAFEMPV